MSETYEKLLAHYAETRDAEAFRQIVMRYRNMVYAACKRILRNGADAEDATQNCFLTLAREPQKVKGSVAGWLHRMATGKSVDIIRRDSARRAREAETMKNDLSEELAAWEDISHALDGAINDLPDELRIPIIRCYLEGHRQEDAAREMGVSQSAVAKRLQRGIETLRAALRKGGWMGSVTLLATLLASKTSEAAPAALTASLGKLAIAGTTGASTGAAAGGTGIIGGLGAMKIGMLAVAAVAIIAIGIGVGIALHKPDTPPIENIEPRVAEPAEENTVSIMPNDSDRETSTTQSNVPPLSVTPITPAIGEQDETASRLPTPIVPAQPSDKEKELALMLEERIAAFSFEQTPLSEVLNFFKLLPQFKGASFIIDEDVGSEVFVTLTMQDVTLQQVLTAMLNPHGRGFIIRDDAILISTPERINQLRLEGSPEKGKGQ